MAGRVKAARIRADLRHVLSIPAYYVDKVANDPVLEALDELVRALRGNHERIQATIARAERIREQREAGMSYREIESGETRPLIVELTRDNLAALVEAGSKLRRAEARALHAEGMTMEQIAELFGVTRQRVSALLRSDRESS
ncbi:MAG: hypothetical protein E6G57_03780 [Actinobacteria bacterium]|nr:MAG: hypothetical protein E6G57_03780 [Actinomycetota bacterium]